MRKISFAALTALVVLTLGTFSFGQTSFGSYVTEAISQNFSQLLTPTTAPTGEQNTANDQNVADTKTASDDVVQAPTALVTIVNYDFNTAVAATPCNAGTPALASGVTSIFSTSATGGTCTTPAGTATTAAAFTQNTTAGTAVSITGFATGATQYDQFQIGGTSLTTYSSYKVYFQVFRSGTGPATATLQYSTNGTTFTDVSPAVTVPSAAPFGVGSFDLSSVTALNGASAITFRIVASGGTNAAGTFRVDNFQVQADNGAAANPTVSLSASSNSASEATPGTTVTITANLSSAVTTDQTVTLGTSGTATLTSDYSLAGANLSGTTLTIPANSTTSSVAFTVIDDTLVEGTENAVLTISNPSSGISLGTPVSQTIAIADNDVAANPTVNLSIAPTTGSETAQTLFTTTATASAAQATDQTVNFALTSGTATAADFTTIAGTITIPANSTTGTTTFSVVDDTLVEGTENATFTISNPSAGISLGTTTTASVSITDNDVAATSDLTITQSAPATVASGGTLVYTVTFNNTPAAAVTTPFAVSFVLPASGFSNPTVTSTGGCSPSGTISGGTVTFTGCTLPATDTQTVTISGTATATGGTITSGTATVDTGNAVTETDETNNTVAGVNTTVNAAPTGVVVNEVYGGGGNSGANYNADYIELYNNGTTTVGIGGYSLQYASAAGNFNGVIVLPSATIAPGGFYLIQTIPAGTNGSALTPNFTSPNNVDLSATNGNVLFAAGTTTVGACPAAGAANVIDRLGYGTGVCFEGAGAAPATSATTSAQRVPNGTDTNNNSADFIARTGTPSAANLGSSAASAQISGRVTTADGRGIQNARLMISGNGLRQPVYVTTGAFGYYKFNDLPAGETYVVSVTAKRYIFNNAAQVVSLTADLTAADFTANK